MITAHRYFNAPLQSLSREQEKDFFAGIRNDNKTFKTTEPVRMLALDDIIIRLLAERNLNKPDILDVAVSSGVTTQDMLERFRASGIEPSIVATDIAIDAAIKDIAPGIRVLVDASGSPLQYECCGLAIRAWNRRIDYITGYWFLTKILRAIPINLRAPDRQAVKLISRWVDAEPISFKADNLLVHNDGLVGRFDVVRAANILNRSYFSESTLVAMISNLKSYCRGPGALIAINRTHQDGKNHGSVFYLKPDNSLEILERVGDGSEVETLVFESGRPASVAAPSRI